jgi:hypothetical protein
VPIASFHRDVQTEQKKWPFLGRTVKAGTLNGSWLLCSGDRRPHDELVCSSSFSIAEN